MVWWLEWLFVEKEDLGSLPALNYLLLDKVVGKA